MNATKDGRYFYLNIYYLFPSYILAFYSGFLYKLVQNSLPQEKEEAIEGYNLRLKFNEGLVLLSLGVGSAITGFWMKMFSERFNAFKLPVICILIVETALFVSFCCYFTQSLALCFVSAFLWGVSYIFSVSNVGGLTSKIFPEKVEAYSVNRLIFNFGTFFFLLINILMSYSSQSLFLGLLVIIQILMTGAAH